MGNAPQGAIVRGGNWDAYRDQLSVVVLLDEKTGQHLTVEPLTCASAIATADVTDADELAAVAARTFPLACPQRLEHIRVVRRRQPVRRPGSPVSDRSAARHHRPLAELSVTPCSFFGDDRDDGAVKLYLPGYHGTGAAAALMHRCWLPPPTGRAPGVAGCQPEKPTRCFYANWFQDQRHRTFRLGATRRMTTSWFA